jgi:D-glycero-alpha-D-manno-heptose-7-phosphate kinase
MIITQTPLRISFLGGGTDFPQFFLKHPGAVVSTAIDKYLYCIVKERFDDLIYVNYSKKEIVRHVDQLEHELVREAMKLTGVTKGIEISFLADIPSSGSGLGSSSSVTVGVLNALYHYAGYTPPAEQLAREACKIEIDICGKPIGIQDQYIAAYGGLRFFEFFWDGRLTNLPLNANGQIRDDLDNHLMLYFTGITRKSSNVLSEQKKKTTTNETVLIKMAKQAHKAKALIEKGKITDLGRLLHQGWELKKTLASKISDPQIDKLYQKALKSGAIGGKISGAGGGGFFLLVVPSHRRDSVRKALKDLKEMPFHLERDGSKVIFNVRR